AEDNLANQHLAVVQLQHLGYRVVTVSTGMRAVEELARRYQDYGLVLMDVQMPEMDGFEATRLIRRGEEISGGHIPIVAMTANVLHDDRQACLDAGMDDFIGKPVLLDDLQKVIARCFQHHEAGVEVRSVALEPTSQDSLLDERILDDLRSLNQSDKPDFLMQLIELYFDDSKSLMQNISAAANPDDPDRLRKAVHSLKGISSNLGAARLSKMCWQVENAIRNNLPLADDWLDALEHEYAITCDALRQVSLHSKSETRGKLN
ncbi:response regulator, partial [bacterium]